MRRYLSTAGLVVFAIGTLGCDNTGSTGGVPGTKDTFTLKSPNSTVTLKQGDRQTIKLNLDRGADFKRVVRLDAQSPKGLKTEFGSRTINPADAADVSLTIEAEKDVAIGDHVVKVTATPEGANASAIDVKVTVEEKK